MSKYLQQAMETIKEGKAPDLMVSIKKWEKPGEVLCGILEEFSDFTGGDYDTPVRKYVIDTGEGRVSTVLGAVCDNSLNPEKLIGEILFIEFLGQEQTGKGHKMNRFNVRLIPRLTGKKG